VSISKQVNNPWKIWPSSHSDVIKVIGLKPLALLVYRRLNTTVINGSYIANSDQISGHKVGSESYLKFESEGWCYVRYVERYKMSLI